MVRVEEVEASQPRSDLPDFNPGDTVRVEVQVIEGEKRRVQAFQGTVIQRRGSGPRETFTVKVDKPDHPITKGLPTTFMHVPDELYGWLRGPAKNLTVLATAFAPKEKGGAGEHEPLLFTVEYGKGRVFQNALGHAPEHLKSVSFIVTFQRGAEWAACGKVTQELPADFPGPDKATVRP